MQDVTELKGRTGMQPLTVSAPSTVSERALAQVQHQRRQRAEYALSRATSMLRLFRASGIACAEDALEGIVAVLSRYPREVIDAVTSPDGLYSGCKWFPTGKEVTDACEAAMAPVRRRLEAERSIAATLAARGEANAVEAARPTREDLNALQARYGKNWGIGGEKEVSRPWPEWMLTMNRRFFERDCIAAGLDPATTIVSPTLARMMAERSEAK